MSEKTELTQPTIKKDAEGFGTSREGRKHDGGRARSKILPCPFCGSTNEGGERIEELEDMLSKIMQWVNAYPLDIFPKPDFARVAKVLEDNGMTLDAISGRKGSTECWEKYFIKGGY